MFTGNLLRRGIHFILGVVMRLWPYLALPAILPFVALACGDVGWSEDANYEAVCVCGVGTPEEFAECLAEGWPPDPETCPPDGGPIGCPGVCAPQAPDGFEGPVLVATGSAIGLGECPKGTKEVVWALADPQLGPRDCPTCACGEPPGTCELPTSWNTHATVCQDPSPASASFDGPANWDGSCTAANAIAEDKLCGGVPCVRSLSVDPPVVTEGDCPVMTEGEEAPDESIPFSGFINQWPTLDSVGALACADDGTPCTYTSCSPYPPSPFKVCVYVEDDLPCPLEWPERSVFFDGGTDNRECSPCSCSPPTGGSCLAQIHVYTDDNCTNEQLSPYVSSDMPPPCHDLMSGISLGSKKAEVIERMPGTCTPQGGEPTGKVEMGKPFTFCCLA